MKLPRKLHKLYANLFGYFWLPCPICGCKFGGHEWNSDYCLWMTDGHGTGVCDECGKYLLKIERKYENLREYYPMWKGNTQIDIPKSNI